MSKKKKKRKTHYLKPKKNKQKKNVTNKKNQINNQNEWIITILRDKWGRESKPPCIVMRHPEYSPNPSELSKITAWHHFERTK